MREARPAAGGGSAGQRLVDAAVALVVLLVPLVGWPPAEHPFSTPKFIVLAAAVVPVFGLAIAVGRLRRPTVPLACAPPLIAFGLLYLLSAALGSLVSPYEVLLQLAAAAWFVVAITCRPAVRVVVRALVVSATIVAAVAILQWARLDPFVLVGYVGEASGRMRVYGTLGNPDFVAVFLVTVIPLTVALAVMERRWRPVAGLCGAVQVAALVATGSRAAALALVAVALFVTIGLRRRRPLFVTLSVLAAAVIVVLSTGRSLNETVVGRVYIWQIAAPHVAERPLVGFGPGAFEPMYVGWQAEAWRAHRFQRWYKRFTAPQDHAHNDFLEIAVDSGVPAAVAFAAFIVSLLVASRRPRGIPALAAGCSMVAICAAALVDFPLHRPAELFVFWIVAGSIVVETTMPSCDQEAQVGAQSGERSL